MAGGEHAPGILLSALPKRGLTPSPLFLFGYWVFQSTVRA